MPEVVYPTISVRAEYPGVAPEEMETLVVRPLEEAFSAAPGVEEIVVIGLRGPNLRPRQLRVRLEHGRGG